ncbi:MAG: hypothetical protein OQK32_03645 [Gammaproteobacteria bacterium]|nr:hypothetical protein [Gammaproteobacteria bacterium]MCW8923057.1 hypothetical protein [Gammaproteobacteria bacterium]
MKQFYCFSFLLLSLLSATAHAVKLSGNISIQSRLFQHDALETNQHNHYNSFALEPEIYHAWDNRKQAVNFAAFYRYDQYDDERTHADIRELSWLKVFDNWELTVGVSKVFWGVTESQHLVDIINQTDQVENTDGEDKLGQPMIRFSTERDWGVLDLFVLPGFRERTFAGIEGRPRIIIDTDAATYESDDGDHHIDYAIRWLSYFDEIELGLSYFSGTSREPVLIPSIPGSFAPHYVIINQIGLDVQAIIEDWTWKLETISRKSDIENYIAATAGFEYTLYGIFETDADLGIVVEYLFDDRDELASSPFQNDITTALRWALNDTQSTEVLLGIITDLDESVVASFIEASRRIGSSFKLTLEARAFNNTVSNRPLHAFRQDDFLQVGFGWYF